MAFPIPINVMCDIYRIGRAPPASPDIPGVQGNLVPRGGNIKPTVKYTHWLDLPLGTDVRAGAFSDTLYVPDKNGTPFLAVKVVRVRPGGGKDFKRVYLNRQAPTWPTNQL
jgi:hypothetical protein